MKRNKSRAKWPLRQEGRDYGRKGGKGMSDELLINSQEASRRLSISKRYFLQQVSAGAIPNGLLIGRRRLWSVSGLAKWVADGCKLRGKAT